MVTIPDRFILEPENTIWDKQTGKRYTKLEDIFHFLDELNNFVVDFETEITRQSNEINGLIKNIDQDCYP